MAVRGIRGAVIAEANTELEILAATERLLVQIIQANPEIDADQVGSIYFTVTPDLNAAFPALAVRRFGWIQVPMLCAQEVPVPGSLERCIRILIHWNTHLTQAQVQHVYLGAARVLRPDWHRST
jgi:chorismate mutase